MLRAAQVLLGIAAIGFLLMASKVAVVGPCTDTLGAFSIIAVVFGAPPWLSPTAVVDHQVAPEELAI